jgi:hypothetical protein
MSTFPAIGTRQAHPGTLTNSSTDTNTANKQLATGNSINGSGTGSNSLSNGLSNAVSTSGTPVSLSQSGLDLSAQGLQNAATDLGNQTIDFAQNFVGSVTQALFGDAANGATISFDSASLETQAGYAAGVQHTSGADGTTDSAALSLNESSHFIGKGTITTSDGQTYQFEVEVQYSASAEAAAGTSSPASAASTPSSTDGSDAGSGDGTDLSSLPTLQLPPISFPGNLSDLFKMLGNQLQTGVPASAQSGAAASGTGSGADAASGSGATAAGQGGTLSLRLLNLIQHATTLGAATGATAAAASASTPSAANAYATQAPSDDPNLAPAKTTTA